MSKVAHPIDWEQFESLIWIPVLSNEQLADILKVSIRHLERQVHEKFNDTIDGIRQQKQGPMRHRLFGAMWKAAMSGNITSQIWLSKNLLEWTDKYDAKVNLFRPTIIERSDGTEIELSAKIGGAIEDRSRGRE